MEPRRALTLTLLEQYRQRGELLTAAAHQLPLAALHSVLIKHRIRPDDAIHCILVHLFWNDVLDAELWCHQAGHPAPTTVADAILMLIHWQEQTLA